MTSREEIAACALSALGLLLAFCLAALWIRVATADGRAVAAAGEMLEHARADDLLLVDPALGRGDRDLGRILFPFRPHFAVALDQRRVDLESFPFSRVLLPAAIDAGHWLGARRGVERDGLRVVENRSGNSSLLRLIDYREIRIDAEAVARPCARRHASGGVACGREPWSFVGPVARMLDGAGTLCLWAHPPRRGTLHIPLTLDVAASSPRPMLEVALNFLDQVRAEPARAPVTLRLTTSAGDQETACNNSQGSCRVRGRIGTGAEARGAIEISTQDNGRQLVCLTGGVRSAATDEVSP